MNEKYHKLNPIEKGEGKTQTGGFISFPLVQAALGLIPDLLEKEKKLENMLEEEKENT